MKGLIIAVVILAGGYLLWAQPWKPKRYNDTAAGQEARRIDEHVQQGVLRQALLLGEEADRLAHVEIAHDRSSND